MAIILMFAEQQDGKLRRASLETVSEARRLAGALGASVAAVVVGPGAAGLADELASYGADEVHVFDDPAFAAYATESYARALAQVIAETKPSVVLVPFTAMGKDLAPRVAAKVGRRPRVRLRGALGRRTAGSSPAGPCTPARPTRRWSGRASRRWRRCARTSSPLGPAGRRRARRRW